MTLPAGHEYRSISAMRWIVGVSNDVTKDSWTQIDRQESLSNGPLHVMIFGVPREGFRFFRIAEFSCLCGGMMCHHPLSIPIEFEDLEIFGILFE